MVILASSNRESPEAINEEAEISWLIFGMEADLAICRMAGN